MAVTGNICHCDVMADPEECINASIITVLQQIYSLILTVLHKDSVAFTNHSTLIYLILKTAFTGSSASSARTSSLGENQSHIKIIHSHLKVTEYPRGTLWSSYLNKTHLISKLKRFSSLILLLLR